MRWVVAGLVWLTACVDSPGFGRCTVRCGPGCPAGLSCGEDDFCHAADDTGSCTDGSSIASRVWRDVAVGEVHTCAVEDGGSLWCWGSGGEGQQGGPGIPHAVEPVRIGTRSDWTSVTADG